MLNSVAVAGAVLILALLCGALILPAAGDTRRGCGLR